jgi:hypothetical protein
MDQYLMSSNDLLQEVIFFYCTIFQETVTGHHFYCFLTEIVLKHIQHDMVHSAVGQTKADAKHHTVTYLSI